MRYGAAHVPWQPKRAPEVRAGRAAPDQATADPTLAVLRASAFDQGGYRGR
jgi:hypothetical protein